MATYFVNSSTVGVDLNNTNATPQFALNSKVLGAGNSEWTYVFATAALTTGMLVSIASAGTAIACTTAAAVAAGGLAFTNGAFAASDYGWVATRGVGITVAISASGTLGAVLYVAGTPGYISTTAGSGTLQGVEILAAGTTATLTTTTAILTWPRCNSAGLG